MKINLPLYLISVLVIIWGIIGLLISINSKFYGHWKEGWPNIVIIFLSVIAGSAIAIGGVFWSFQKETNRAYELQADIFKGNFGAIISECAENQAVINKLKKEISTTHFNLQLLSNQVSNRLIENSLLYKYTGDEYLYALRTYLVTVKISNRMLNFVFEDFKRDGVIESKNIKDLNKRLDECLYYLYILQYQSQLYVHSYNVKWGPKPGNYEEVMDWIRKKKEPTIEELKNKIDELGKLGEKERKELQESIKKILKKEAR